jgi:tryptophanyl-tRNA synthetase
MRVLSGIQPSGDSHIGNFFGSIKPNIDLLGEGENIYFIADLHALTTVFNPVELREARQNVILDLLACGFDASKAILFFQSDVPEHTELAWILSCITPVGLLERAVSYKDKVQKGLEASHGLFSYPVLMAADILLYDSDVVPVGKDQKQHVEMTRDIAQKFNHRYGEGVLVIPDVRIRDDVAVVPGVDGQKMSKSYGNTIPLFGDEKLIKKAIMGIVTDSKDVTAPKDPETCTVYNLHKLFLSKPEAKTLAEKYKAGGLGYGDAKKMLLETYMDYFGPMRAKREEILKREKQEGYVTSVMTHGAKRAQEIAGKTMRRVRKAVGLRA